MQWDDGLDGDYKHFIETDKLVFPFSSLVAEFGGTPSLLCVSGGCLSECINFVQTYKNKYKMFYETAI